jgi:phenylacetate-coenzyme A ligase PaaK-like adenylate-forming protein
VTDEATPGSRAVSADLPPFDPWRSAWVGADIAVASSSGATGLAERRAHRLAALLDAAARGSALYRRILAGRDPAGVRLEDLPVTHRAELMHRFDEWVADPALNLDALRRFTADPHRIGEACQGQYVVWESSGSSGEPGIFVQDASAMAVYDGLEALRRPTLRPWQRLLDPWLLSERIVFVGATGGHFASTVSIERLRRLHPTFAPHWHSVSFLQPAARLVAQLQALAPTIVATYPSAAVLLAEERVAGRLDIAPREIWTGGEMLSSTMRQAVMNAFGCPVADNYGASEFLTLASECSLGHLHLNSDWAILEPVDARGRPVANDRLPATTLLTNLANHVQPLIRYDLGDRVTLHATRCACGSSLPVIEVQGRCDDALRLGRPDRPATLVLPLALSTVLEEEAGLFDFQLVQLGPCEVLLRTGLTGQTGRAALRRARAALSAFLEAQGAPGVKISCRAGEPARAGASGKIRRVVATAA